MSRFSSLGDILTLVLDQGARLIDRAEISGAKAVIESCAVLMSAKGEASGVALAREILAGYAGLNAADRLTFFRHLADAYDPSAEEVSQAALIYADERSSEALATLLELAEPPRQELLRRLNMAPGGTAGLVAMRTDLLTVLKEHPELARIDADFRHLLSSWFNRGFLVMQPIDWQTPAAVLEKIIAYEAVHEIDSWDELRRRVEPADRRCFGFFHPSMPDEPLIFVEVALMQEIPGAIAAVLAPEREVVAPEAASVAVFYSISNCQAGLAGVSFGAFLIKQVVEDLARALPGVKDYVTLSPVPGFTRWLGRQEGEAETALRAALEQPDWAASDETADPVKAQMTPIAARYFLKEKRPDGHPPDPVARFHLGNGAELHAIHWMGD
ncbi:MAG: malonyl-CoA decarboxylase, partial [Pseudomonadota bacterium]